MKTQKYMKAFLMVIIGLAFVVSYTAPTFADYTVPKYSPSDTNNNKDKAGSASCPKDKNGNENCSPGAVVCSSADDTQGDNNCRDIFNKYLIPAVNMLSAAVGIIVVAVIIFSGIQFSASDGNPEAAASARKHMINAVIALVAFLFLWAFLNFLIPGGLFSGLSP